MADYDPNTVSAYQQYGQSMMAGGGGRNMSGLGARQSTSSMTTVPDGPVDFTTIDTKTGTQKKVATIDYGSDNDDGPSYVNPTVIYHAAANASEDAGSVLTPTAPMINAANLYSMPNMAEQVYDYVYRADRDDAITSAIRSTQAEEQDSVDAAIKSINKAITQGKTDAEIAEAFLNDMGGMGNDKPDPNGNFGIPGVTLKDVTDTDEGALSNPQPLYDFAEEMRNPSITVEELPPLTPDQKEKLGAKLREASDKGDLSSVMNQLAQDSKVQLSSAVTNFIEGAETQVASNNIDPITGLPFGDGDELGFTDVSPSAEAAEQQGLMARPAASDERQDPSYWDSVLFGDTEAEAETPTVETATTTTEDDTTYSDTTNAVYTDFYTNNEEGDTAHIGQDSQNLTLPAGIVADGGVKYDGKEVKAGKNTVKASDFDASKVDMSKAYKKVGDKTYKREDYDSDEAWSKAIIEGFKDVVKGRAGDSWDDLTSSTKQAVTKLAWNNGEGWAKYNTSKALYKELAKDTKDKTVVANGILNYSTVAGGGASIGVAKARANAWNKMSDAHGFAEINKIVADNTGAKTKFNYYDAQGNLVHTETTSRAPSKYSSSSTEIEKDAAGNW